MGTRSLTTVIETYRDEKKEKQVKIKLVKMYRQYDGYPEGHGVELVEFLNDGKVVNGLGADDINKKRVFNGAGCLAAQLIAHFKDGAGGIYIQPITTTNCGQEYEYEIVVDFDTKDITLKCLEVGYIDSKGNYKSGKKTLFEGKPTDFEQFLEKRSETV